MASAIPAITGFASGLSGDPTAFNLIVKQQQKQRQKELLQKAGIPENQILLVQEFPSLASSILKQQLTPLEKVELAEKKARIKKLQAETRRLDAQQKLLEGLQKGLQPDEIAQQFRKPKDKVQIFNEAAKLSLATGNIDQFINFNTKAEEERLRFKKLQDVKTQAQKLIDTIPLEPTEKRKLQQQIKLAKDRNQIFSLTRSVKSNPATIVGLEVSQGLLKTPEEVRARLSQLGVTSKAKQDLIVEQTVKPSITSKILSFFGIQPTPSPESPLAKAAQTKRIPSTLNINGQVVRKLLTPEERQAAQQAGLLQE